MARARKKAAPAKAVHKPLLWLPPRPGTSLLAGLSAAAVSPDEED